MNSSMVNKIVKAKQYAQQPERVAIRRLELEFTGDNDRHAVSFEGDSWSCTCDFFVANHICSHTMAVERMLDPMLKVKQTLEEPAGASS